jgi:hypothetical protein
MKKTASKRPKVSNARVSAPALKHNTPADELRPHYDFDYSTAKPNRFVSRFGEGAVAVVLEPDVANVFRSSDVVNNFLRSAISAMPHAATGRKKRAS